MEISPNVEELGGRIALAVRRGAVGGDAPAVALELSDMGDGTPAWWKLVEHSVVWGQSVLPRLAGFLRRDEGGDCDLNAGGSNALG